jgi:predicted XRE-type DNA-binding protein
MEIERAASVWELLTDSPKDAANMTMRSTLLTAIGDAVAACGLPQSQVAARLGITQPWLNDLLRGRIANFSLDALVNLTAQAGLAVRVDVTQAERAA